MKFPLNIVYNIKDKKVGCVLLQPLLGGDLSGGDVSRHFKPNTWELSPEKCKLYRVNNKKEFERIVEMTNEAH